MNTTLKQMTLPTPKGDEVLDMTEFATNESVVNGLASVESKVETESQAIQSAIQNIDLSSVENKVDEVKQAVNNIDLSPIETKVDEGVATLSEVKDALAEVKTMVTPAFTISIKGKNGKYNISFAGIIEAEQEASSFMEGNTLHIPNATMQGSTLMLNARVEGNILYL